MIRNEVRTEKTKKRLVRALLVMAAISILLVVAIVAISIRGDSSIKADAIMSEEMGNTLAIYQEFIDAADSEEVMIELMRDKLNYIIDTDTEHQFGDIAIAEAIQIDDMVKSLDSAGVVINVSSSYGRDDLVSEYSDIMTVRQNMTEMEEE